MLDEFRAEFKAEIVEVIRHRWDDNEMYLIGKCLLGELHPLVRALKLMMDSEPKKNTYGL